METRCICTAFQLVVYSGALLQNIHLGGLPCLPFISFKMPRILRGTGWTNLPKERVCMFNSAQTKLHQLIIFQQRSHRWDSMRKYNCHGVVKNEPQSSEQNSLVIVEHAALNHYKNLPQAAQFLRHHLVRAPITRLPPSRNKSRIFQLLQKLYRSLIHITSHTYETQHHDGPIRSYNSEPK